MWVWVFVIVMGAVALLSGISRGSYEAKRDIDQKRRDEKRQETLDEILKSQQTKSSAEQ